MDCYGDPSVVPNGWKMRGRSQPAILTVLDFFQTSSLFQFPLLYSLLIISIPTCLLRPPGPPLAVLCFNQVAVVAGRRGHYAALGSPCCLCCFFLLTLRLATLVFVSVYTLVLTLTLVLVTLVAVWDLILCYYETGGDHIRTGLQGAALQNAACVKKNDKTTGVRMRCEADGISSVQIIAGNKSESVEVVLHLQNGGLSS